MNKTTFIAFLLSVFISFGAIKTASAQNTLDNISSINVDNLNDQELRQLLQRAQNAGISDTQLLQQAQARGMDSGQLQRLQARINEIRKKSSKSKSLADTILSGKRDLNYKQQDFTDTSAAKIDVFADLKPKIFGADLFKKSRNNTFEPNLKLATPINYIVGPEDQLNINVYGNSLVNWELNVSPEGNINIPGIGILNVAGKTIETVTALVKSKLAANNYAIGRGTNVQVSLGNIRSIRVTMIGQLERPGTYTLPSLATVFNALYAAGGPSETGTFRQIEVIRNNRVIRTLDVYDFLVKGSQKDNIALRDQDVIRVPTYRTRVELVGQVKIPALFEVLPGESFQNVLNFAGGFTDSAYVSRIKISQISGQQRKLADLVEANYSSYTPLRGDIYYIESVLNRFINRVVINGAVFRPGEYELQNGLTVGQLIEKAAGLREDAFTERGTITRLKPDNSIELIAFSVKDVLNKAVTILLQREDVVFIASIFDLRNPYQITINGSVRKPGTLPFAENMKLEDLILNAGGFAEGASAKRIEVARRVYNSDPESKNSKVAQVFIVNVDSQLKLSGVDFVLEPFDIVSVYTLPGFEKQRTVKVEGEVLYPGFYTIQTKDEKISSLVARSGGLTASADAMGGSLKRDNIAILGVDKNKSDTTGLALERTDQLKRLKRTNRGDTTNVENLQPRNNYVGINLEKILKTPGSKIDLLLEDGDVLRVPKQQQTVRVNGEVLYPSAVVYSKAKSFKAYVLNAGGFSPEALKSAAYVVYPNGTVRGTKKIFFFNNHPAVRPGSEIFVPNKSKTAANVLQTIFGFTSGLASLGAIILGIISVTK